LPGQVRVDGSWKNVNDVDVRVGGAWKTVNAGYTRISGVWKQWYPAGQPAFEHIATTILTSTTNQILFTDLGTYSSDYKHLQIRYSSKSTTSTNDSFIRFNGATNSVYARHTLAGISSSVTSTNQTSATLINLPLGMSRSTTASAFSGGIIDILDPFSTTKNTTTRALTGIVDSQTAIALQSGLWNNTASITSITLGVASGSFAIGSRFSLYGIRG
jgi:hypothetical protein